ncbi:hypothetical protein LCGC14_2819200 [marine sediment metagenome]|uniref:Uncharacterized protein n=1 Tax=marine sediment metagenome TaxID=412755 RepID=A0A0F9AR17_9ZZZZ
MPSPLTSLITPPQRGRKQRGGQPGQPQQAGTVSQDALTATQPDLGKQIGKESTIGFLAEKMLGGLANKKKRQLGSRPQGLSTQSMNNWRI